MDKKKVTIKDLIARKETIKERVNKTVQLHIKSLDGLITIQKPSRQLVLDALDMGKESGDSYMAYNTVIEPNLKDKELQEAYGCVAPMEIVDKIFEPGEVAQIAQECVILAGYGDSVKLVDEVKN